MKVDGDLPPLYLTIEDLRERLTVAKKQDLLVELKHVQQGKYLLPLEAILALSVDVLGTDLIAKKTTIDTKAAISIEEDAVSQAASTFTVPAGKYRIINSFHVSNTTRATYWSIDIGGEIKYVTSGTGNRSNGAFYDNRINAGETVNIIDMSFVAADNVFKAIAYEEYDA